ncbi:hypothetical protein H7U19_09810 [Hyunsoonleella sp. SJ7]|uniref:DUF4838 domain-containing protein n=1 Tax=Hyunsoonleella aquatilis TaxID=2762758 RepID=A0A923HED9_9FLAO|nr:hypothetical protein [Hyunsoonleella aquatilis]MBC3758698.1 hypothetical protein [Hyunsoonleella aquatilis]
MKCFTLINLVLFCCVVLPIQGVAQSIEKNTFIQNNEITLIDRTTLQDSLGPVNYGKRNLIHAIEASGGKINKVRNSLTNTKPLTLVIGALGDSLIGGWVADEPKIKLNKPEGVFYQWRNTKQGRALVAGGTNAIGLAYALNELADQIKYKGLDALTEIENTIEYPDNQVRGLDKFIASEHDDTWFFSEDYWEYYCGKLVKNRFNRLTLITGYNDGKNQEFMIPVYPYLFDVQGFEGVSLIGEYKNSPTQYLNQLRKIGKTCHDYGLDFVFGIWGHGRSDELVSGLPEDDTAYTTYCSKGMLALLQKVPEIDGIQLRVNYESGVGGFGNTADHFWKEIIDAIAVSNRGQNRKVFLDIRAKGLTKPIREFVSETGLDFSVTSKYTWEGVGLPYHPMEMRKGELTMLYNVDKRQRYGYADFLSHSRNFDFIYRLWGVGTMRMFTWADPDYARRFSQSTSFGNAKGFQVTPPLGRKLNTWRLFKDDTMEYFTWEDERYWAWYVLFGRLGYSSNVKPQVWEREFKARYDKAYKNVLSAYRSASKVLPLITSSHLTFHPGNYNWAEIESGGALFVAHNANPYYILKNRTYQSSEPGDPGLFYSIEDYVKDQLKDSVRPKITPGQLAKRFSILAKDVLRSLDGIRLADIPEAHKKEFITNEIDLKILSNLAQYHSFKIKAATDFSFYEETQNKGYLKSSLQQMYKAKSCWAIIDSLTEQQYFESPRFLHDNGSWKGRLVEIDKDINKIEGIIKDPSGIATLTYWRELESKNDEFVKSLRASVPGAVSSKGKLAVALLTGARLDDFQQPKVHYREANMTKGKFNELNMEWDGTKYVAKIPMEVLDSNYDVLLYFTLLDTDGGVIVYPGLYNEIHSMPYFHIER